MLDMRDRACLGVRLGRLTFALVSYLLPLKDSTQSSATGCV